MIYAVAVHALAVVGALVVLVVALAWLVSDGENERWCTVCGERGPKTVWRHRVTWWLWRHYVWRRACSAQTGVLYGTYALLRGFLAGR